MTTVASSVVPRRRPVTACTARLNRLRQRAPPAVDRRRRASSAKPSIRMLLSGMLRAAAMYARSLKSSSRRVADVSSDKSAVSVDPRASMMSFSSCLHEFWPSQTPHASTLPVQHTPPASSWPEQHLPVTSTATPVPPHTPHASRFPAAQQAPLASTLALAPEQQVPSPMTTPTQQRSAALGALGK